MNDFVHLLQGTKDNLDYNGASHLTEILRCAKKKIKKVFFPSFSVSGGLIIESAQCFLSLFTQGTQRAEWYTRGQTGCWRGQLSRRCVSLVNQRSTLPSHATTTTQANIPNDGLLRSPRTPYGLLWSLKGAMDRHKYIFTPTPMKKLGFQLARRHWQCISHWGTWVKSEPDKSRVLSGLCPACSCHLLG